MKSQKFNSLFDFAPKSKVLAGDGLDDGNFPFYTSSSVLKKRINKAQHFGEAIIFGTGGSASVHFSDEPFSTSTDCLVALSTSNEFNTKFAYYYLFSNIHLLEEGFKGAGLKHISKSYIENLDIPILSLETQNKIVTVLDKATRLVDKRKKATILLDELINSTFLQMFGDPYTNSSSWQFEELGNYLEYIGDIGSNGSNSMVSKNLVMKDEEDYAIMIRTVNLSNNDFDKNVKYISKTTYNFFSKSKIYGGEIIMNKIGSNAGDFWIMPKLNKPISLGLNQLVIRPKNLNNIFLFYFLSTNYGKLSVKSKVRGAATKSITKTAIRNLKIYHPPIELQKDFEEYYLRNRQIWNKFKRSEKDICDLLNSLQQKAFTSQLNFDLDFELDALISEIDLQKKQNDISKISDDIAYLQRLIDKLNTQEFKDKTLYNKAKHAAFHLMITREQDRKVTQIYLEKTKKIELALI